MLKKIKLEGAACCRQRNALARHQAFTVLNGFGKRVTPVAPFRVHIDGRQLHCASGSLHEKIDPDRSTKCTPDVCTVAHSHVALGRWHLEIDELLLPFPAGYVLSSVAGSSDTPFYLDSPQRESIYMRTPQHLSLDHYRLYGWTVLEDSHDTLELSYRHAGELWHQRHRVLRLAGAAKPAHVLTLQAPQARMNLARPVLESMIEWATSVSAAADVTDPSCEPARSDQVGTP